MKVDSVMAARLSMVLFEVIGIMATAYVIARTIKAMCFAAAASDRLGIDNGVSTLFAFIMLVSIQGGLLATTLVLLAHRNQSNISDH